MVVAGWALLAVLLAASLSGCAADPPPAPPPAGAVRVLQMNLCGSGIASCYTDGRASAEAAGVIRAERPDAVTVNEICDGDLAGLRRALADTTPDRAVSAAFQPARDGSTGRPYRCRDGGTYGIGVLARGPLTSPPAAGLHPDQDPADPEQRAWLCLDAAGPVPSVCTTHLAYTDADVTLAQCRYLFGTVVAAQRARTGGAPVVVGADLNLGPGLARCLPPDGAGADDGGPQHVVPTPGLAVAGVRMIDLDGTTDHPGLLVTLTPGA